MMFRGGTFALIAAALVGAVVTIYSAIGQAPYFPDALRSQRGDCPPSRHYPGERRPVIDEFEADWFRRELRAFHEPPIFGRHRGQPDVVRFTYLRSFHPPIIVRTLDSGDGEVRLVAKEMEGRDGCSTPGSTCAVDRLLTVEERRRLDQAKARLLRSDPYGCYGGVDGSKWIIEASGSDHYALWHEWSPEDGPLRDLGLTMLELTGWQVQHIY